MSAKKSNLKNPIYHDDDAARAHLEALLWPHGPVCPRCGVTEDRITKLQGKSTRPGVYKCKDCRKPFTVTVGTVMERSKVSLSSWVLAAHFMASSKKGMSALQLQRMMGTNYETAWFLFHRLREAAREVSPGPLGGEGKTIEADETYVGGWDGNRHAHKQLGANWAEGRQPVVTLVERDGRARSFHVANVTAKSVRRVLTTNAHRFLSPDDGRLQHLSRCRLRVRFARQHRRSLLRDPEARDHGDVPQRLGSPPSPLPVGVRFPLVEP
jgi:transposase-like protein